MERKFVTSVINSIVRENFESPSITLQGIALWLCRQNEPYISTHYRKEVVQTENYFAELEFDYEDLFSEGSTAAEYISKRFPESNLRILKENFAITAEILLQQSFEYDFRPPYTPAIHVGEEESRFLLRFLDPKPGTLVYNPFAGDYYAATRYPNVRFISTSLDYYSSRFAELLQVARGLRNSIYHSFNPFTQPYLDLGGEGSAYHTIYIPAMPYGINIAGTKRKAGENYLLGLFRNMPEDGKMVVVLPASALSADNYFELRKTLIETQALRRVILLGPRAKADSQAISTVAFVIEKSRNENSVFYFHDLSKLQISEEAYNLVVTQHPSVSIAVKYSTPFSTHNVQIFGSSDFTKRIDRPGFKYVKLASLLTPYSNYRELDGTEMVARLSGKDMHLKLPEYMIDIQDVELAPVSGRFTCIKEPVFCFHGITQNYLWCVGDPDYPVYCNGDIYTYRISSDLITPEYLCFILGEEDIMADIKSRVIGATIPRISRHALLDVVIPVPDRDRQDLITQDLQQYISTKKTMLAEMEKRSHEANIEDIREDIKDKVHLLGPYNANIQTGIYRVIKMLQRGDSLEADTKVFRDSDIELMGFLKRLLVKSQDAGYIMASIGETIFEEAKRPLDIFTFIQEYVASLQSDDEYEGISFEITPIERPVYLMITDRSLRLVLDTIVRNAVSHGFPDSFTGAKRIKFTIDSTPEASHAVISVANNGMPAAEGFSDNLYVSKFGKCGPTAHSGRGGYFVSKAMDFYKGYVFVNTSNAEWPFDVWLHIPMSNE